MDIASILAEAYKAVQDAGIPKELQQAAFEKAVDLASGDGVRIAPQTAFESAASAEPASAPAEDDLIGRIAQKLKLDRESVERIYDVSGDELRLVLPSPKLSSGKKPATEEIALLVAAGRQAAGLDQETTDSDYAREIAEHYRRYDQANFSRVIKDMHDVFIVRTNGRKKLLKMTQPGWEAACELASRILGGE